jgi:hypothetical protein
VGTGSGTSQQIDWTWDASTAPKGRYFWMIGAGPGVRPATGTIGAKAPPFGLSGVTATPEVVTPNGDGIDDSSTISYSVTRPASVTATLVDTTTGATIATLFDGFVGSGPQAFVFYPDAIPDGTYEIAITATSSDGVQATGSVFVTVTRAAPQQP